MDLPPDQVGAEEWTFGQNVVIGNDSTRNATAAIRVWGNPIARPLWLSSCPFVAAPKVGYASSAALHATDGVNHATITPAAGFTGSAQAHFTGGMFNGLAVFNARSNPPCYWGGSLASIALPLPGYPVGDRAWSMRPFKYFLVQAGGIINGVDSPFGVRWSVSAAPGNPPATWAPAPTNDAGEVTLAGAREGLVDLAPVRDSLLIFEAHATWILNYIGGAYTFGNRKALSTAGLLAPNSWAALGTEVIFVADGDVLATDSQVTRSILTRRMRTAMFGQLNVAARERVFLTVSAARRQVMIAFPSGTNTYCDKALVWDFADDNLGIVDLPQYSFAVPTYAMNVPADNWDADTLAWDDDTTLWDLGGFNSSDAYIVAVRPDYGATGAFEATQQQQSSPDGPLECIVRKEKMPLGEANRMAHVARIYPKVQGQDGVETFWRVGTSRTPGESTSWGAEQSFVLGRDEKIDVRQTGRYVSVQMRTLTDGGWQLTGFDVDFRDAGAR